MVPQFFKLREQPFGVTPDPKYLYASSSHREALASLLYGLQTGLGFVSLIAKPGMGKTTLLFEVLRRLRGTKTTVFLFQTISTPVDLLRAILIDLGVKDAGEGLVDLQTQLNRVLLRQFAAHSPVVVVIDEAQNLNDSVLETVRMLSNFETASYKLMQILLVGQPQLAEKLISPDLLQLRQRISIFAHLTPLSTTETGAYILERLRIAGMQAGECIFTPSAVALIARHSEGIPRNINNLCFNAMSTAFAMKCSMIDVAIVEEVISDLNVRDHLLFAEAYGEMPEGPPALSVAQRKVAGSFRGEDQSGFQGETEGSSDGSHPESSANDPKAWSRKPGSHKPFTDEEVPQLSYAFASQAAPNGQAISGIAYHDAPSPIESEHPHLNRYDSTDMAQLLAVSDDVEQAPSGVRWRELSSSDHATASEDKSNDATAGAALASWQEPRKPSVNPASALPILSNLESGSKRRTITFALTLTLLAGLTTAGWLGMSHLRTPQPESVVQTSPPPAQPSLPSSQSTVDSPKPREATTRVLTHTTIRVKRAESLVALCQNIYGDCTLVLLKRLLILNPSLSHPNHLRPGQLVSIPLDSHIAKTTE